MSSIEFGNGSRISFLSLAIFVDESMGMITLVDFIGLNNKMAMLGQ
jgi:hypothetical protein